MTTCYDMYRMKKNELVQLFGSYGYSLYNLIRGLVDDREVKLIK